MHRLTSDVTYHGRPLNPAAYAASLRLLQEFSRGPVQSLRATTLNQDEHEAWIALVSAGVVRARPTYRIASFRWDVYALTTYGEVYARQRLGLSAPEPASLDSRME